MSDKMLTDAEIDAIVARAWRIAHDAAIPLPGWTGVAMRSAITEAYAAGAAAATARLLPVLVEFMRVSNDEDSVAQEWLNLEAAARQAIAECK